MCSTTRKILSVILCISVLLSCLLVSGSFVSAEGSKPWDGSADTALAGSGSENDPYLITNAGELYFAVSQTGNNYYKLTNDIIINDITVKVENGKGVLYGADGTTALTEDEITALNPWHDGTYHVESSKCVKFKGTIDGDGHIVRGLYISNTITDTTTGGYDYKYARALIPYTTGATISNLGLEDAYVSVTNGTASGIIGNLQNSMITMENCYVGANAYFYGYNSSALLGGGSVNNLALSVKNCYSQATITTQGSGSDYRAGAIFADA